MKDMQKTPPDVSLTIDCTGIKGLVMPLTVRNRQNGVQATVARVDMGVELSPQHKGTHMSRFIEAVEQWARPLDTASFSALLESIKTLLEARRAYVSCAFPFFVRKKSPATARDGVVAYDCRIVGQLDDAPVPHMQLEVCVPVMSVCPCSKAISAEGAHSQRAILRIGVGTQGFVWLEELIDIGESAGSSPIYTLLKREDEKFVTEAAFARPMFVEDMVRFAAQKLMEHPRITWYRVEVESQESIHGHAAFARLKSANAPANAAF